MVVRVAKKRDAASRSGSIDIKHLKVDALVLEVKRHIVIYAPSNYMLGSFDIAVGVINGILS